MKSLHSLSNVNSVPFRLPGWRRSQDWKSCHHKGRFSERVSYRKLNFPWELPV